MFIRAHGTKPGFSLLAAGCAAILLSACASLDRFSARATDFNQQVAEVQDQTLLLNIMRSAYRLPMHFSELSTLSGTSSVSGTAAFTFPFFGLNAPDGNGPGGSGSPSFTVSQSPTFNVAVLETQEFYNGMLAPLTEKQMYLYINAGVQKALIFTLALGAIDFQAPANTGKDTIENNFHPRKTLPEAALRSAQANVEECRTDAASRRQEPKPPKSARAYCDSEQARFTETLNALIARGLTIEKISDPDTLGPPLADDKFDDPSAIGALVEQKLDVVYVDNEACRKRTAVCPDGLGELPRNEQAILRASRGGYFYRVQKPNDTFRFCFERGHPRQPSSTDPTPAESIRAARIEEKALCHCPPPQTGNSACADESDPVAVKTDKSIALPAEASASPPPENRETVMQLSFSSPSAHAGGGNGNSRIFIDLHPRSTEGVIYFLGEIARCELNLDPQISCAGERPRVHNDARNEDDRLFEVFTNSSVPKERKSELSIKVGIPGKEDYSVLIDPSASDRSAQVMSIVSQLLALHRNAKDFPAPAIIPLLR